MSAAWLFAGFVIGGAVFSVIWGAVFRDLRRRAEEHEISMRAAWRAARDNR